MSEEYFRGYPHINSLITRTKVTAAGFSLGFLFAGKTDNPMACVATAGVAAIFGADFFRSITTSLPTFNLRTPKDREILKNFNTMLGAFFLTAVTSATFPFIFPTTDAAKNPPPEKQTKVETWQQKTGRPNAINVDWRNYADSLKVKNQVAALG